MFSQWLKFVLAARKKQPEDGGSIYHILFFVGVAVIYALNGIFKMRRDKESEKAAEELSEQVKKQSRYKSLREAVTARRPVPGQVQKSLPYARHPAQKRIPPAQIRRQPAPTQQRPQPRPAQRPQPTAREMIQQVLKPLLEPEQSAQRPQRRPRPARRRPVARRPQVQKQDVPKAKDLVYAKAAKTAKKKKHPAPVETAAAASAFVSLGHLSRPDNLKMAIVYAEILGKPVGLRDI